MRPATPAAYELLHRGTLALADIEANGIRIDTEYLDSAMESTADKIESLKKKLRGDSIYDEWRREYGQKMNLNASDQLAHILYDVLGHECPGFTGKLRRRTDESALEGIDIPFVVTYRKLRQLQKVLGTFLTGIKRHTVDGVLHAIYNLHITSTYRSSSNDPNFQNFPIRNKELAEIIRRSFIPSHKNSLIETDISGAEVRVAACYHKDPTMLKYIKDKSRDMHRDMAAQIYMLAEDQVTKDVRHMAKNMFVFPSFYGDYYINSARNMWEAISRFDLKTVDGIGLFEHLESQGITRMGRCDPDQQPRANTFEKHMLAVQKHFWEKRFKVYNKWKKNWYDAYLRDGGFDTLTGFHIEGLMARNDVINYPIQGSAFHMLLWSLIKVNDYLKKHKMKSRLVGQIHDSMIGDVHPKERDDYIYIVNKIMTKDLLRAMDWIITPIEVEFEESHTNWHEKKAIVVA